jgi:hypothetical protein
MVESLEAGNITLPREIVVNTHKDGIGVAIADLHPTWKRNEIITLSGHHGLESLASQLPVNPHRSVQCQPFLVYLSVTSTIISASMTGVNDNGIETTGSGN